MYLQDRNTRLMTMFDTSFIKIPLQVAQVIAYKFGIELKFIKIRSTNTFTAPNDDNTGGSNASDGVTRVRIFVLDKIVDESTQVTLVIIYFRLLSIVAIFY